MKKTLLTIFLFITISNVSYWNSEDITNMKNWVIYKSQIDKSISKYNNDRLKLEKKIEKFNSTLLKIERLKESQLKEQLTIITNYILFTLNSFLLNIEELENKAIEDNNVENVDLEKNVITEYKSYKKEDLYDWFSNNYNDEAKSIKTWIESFIYNWSVIANIEELNVNELKFTLGSSDLSNFKYSFKEISLYIEWKKIKTINSNKFTLLSSTTWEILFDNLEWFIIPKENIEFRLSIIPEYIWYEKIWKFTPDITISKTTFLDVEWIISNNKVTWNMVLDSDIEKFQITPILLELKSLNNLNDSLYPEFNLSWEFWWDSDINSNWWIKAEIKKLRFLLFESNWNAVYKLVNKSDSSNYVIWNITDRILEFDLSTLSDRFISKWKWEDFVIYISDNTGVTVSLELLRDWVEYSIDWISLDTIKLYNEKWLSFWSRSY